MSRSEAPSMSWMSPVDKERSAVVVVVAESVLKRSWLEAEQGSHGDGAIEQSWWQK